MRKIILLLVLLPPYFLYAQSLDEFEVVDKTKIEGCKTIVYFNDPLKHLLAKHPNFDNKENKEKHELLSEYLHHNSLYIFDVDAKKRGRKTYWLIGNSRKVRIKNYFDLVIKNSDGSVDKVIDKMNVGGSLFEHMMIFQTPEGKAAVGNGIQIWGYFALVQPYEPIKERITALIKQDLTNTLPLEFIAKAETAIEPLFEYQECGVSSVVSRVFTVTVYQYDSSGNMVSQRPRTEKDNELYYTSTSQDLTGVATFPYFSAGDKTEKVANTILVKSNLANINHYLKDVKITIDQNSEQPEKIEGKLIVHGYTAEGHSARDELYIAEFSVIKGCSLPKLVKFCSPDDVNYERPRLTIAIEYEFK